ncbi:hypothetical protein Btru_045200 [Bulinus truncatus]|nr:hypothetical protein Btru_045200 [Bulinus truncatus]
MSYLLILCLTLHSGSVQGSPLSSNFLVRPEGAASIGAPLSYLRVGGSKLTPTLADSGTHDGTLTVTLERSSGDAEEGVPGQGTGPEFSGLYVAEETERPGGEVRGGSSVSGQCNNKLAPPSSANIIKNYCKPNKTAPVIECYRRGTSVCRCQGGVADCSGKPNIPNIDYVPKLPPAILCVNFANNNVQALTESYFANVSHIRVLDFSNNNLETVSVKTFAKLSDLVYLILNDNHMKVKNLKNVLNSAPKQRLDISRVILDMGVFMEVQNMTTQEIVMDFNYIPKMDLSLLSSVRGLKALYCRCCSINSLVSSTLPNLTVLDVRYNNISVFPQTCRANSTRYHDDRNQSMTSLQPEMHLPSNASLFPKLTQLFLDDNCLLQLPERTEVCIDKINVFSLARNNITRVPYKFFASFAKLSRLDFGKMNVPVKIIENGSFGAPYMTTLYLNRNNISFNDDRISKTLFEGADRLGDLFIDHNQIGSLPETDLEEVFRYTVKLKHLYMSDTGLTSIPVRAFSRLNKLQSLFLYNNKIQNIPDAAFDEMASLTRLLLQNNQISVVKESSFSPGTIANLTEIDLSRNMFLCNCDLLWFQQWLRSNASRAFDHLNAYICSDLHNVRVQDYKESAQSCLMSRANYVIFMVCLCIVLSVFLLFVTIFRYRWHIRLLLYERRTSSKDLARLQGDYKYDLFIIYCNDDNEWVEKELLYLGAVSYANTSVISGTLGTGDSRSPVVSV